MQRQQQEKSFQTDDDDDEVVIGEGLELDREATLNTDANARATRPQSINTLPSTVNVNGSNTKTVAIRFKGCSLGQLITVDSMLYSPYRTDIHNSKQQNEKLSGQHRQIESCFG